MRVETPALLSCRQIPNSRPLMPFSGKDSAPRFLGLQNLQDLGVHQNDRDISRNKGSSTQSSYTSPYVYSSHYRDPVSEYMWVILTYTYIHIHMLICVYIYIYIYAHI